MEEMKTSPLPYCREKFERIDRRLDAKSVELDEAARDIAVLQSDMHHLTKSLNGLTKALWGVAGTTLATLLGFFIWYIQSM